jgi:RHS repeat-associated protein
MLTDRNKGISTPITYNYMNLPEHVVKASNSIDYVYDAAGIKHAQRVSGTQLAMTTEYAGPWIFQNNQLQFLQHKEGRIIMAKRTLLYKNTGDDLETVSATAGATLAKQTINGETYIKITESAGQPAKTGLTEIGGSIPVSAGDRILYRVKAYHPSAGHSLYVGGATTTGGTLTDVLWRGAALQAGATNEAWVENIVVVPAGKVELAFGILTEAASGSGATAYVNEIEIYKLETSAPEYQYDLKDHLGNVRVTFTTKTTNGQFTAGFETASQATEASIFENYPAGAQINTQPEHAHTGNNSHWMNGGYAGQVGVAKSMAVMPGDQVKIEAFATYGAETNTPTDFSSFVPLLLSAFNLPAPAAGELGTASSAISAFGTWEMGPTGDASHDDPVKGFVTIVLFDRDYNFLDVAYKPAGNSGDLISQTYTVKEPGYAYLYVSNENPTRRDIYFDDVRITHTPSLIIQREDYYPFGLTFNAYNRENSVPQNYKYNGKEEQTALGLGWLDYGARMYQPELGRFFTQDKFASKSVDASPYSYGLNNPALYVDINGDSVWTTTQTHTDANGNVTVTNTINITGKVLRQSSGTAKAQEVATGLNARLNAQKDTSGPKKNADGTTTTTITKINANFTAASSMSDVSSKDHLVVIVDNVTGKADPKLGGGEAGGLAVLGGQIAYVENAGAVESAFHEVGHNLGMEHPDSNNGNPMSYNGSGNNFSSLQMMQTYNRARNGALNQGSNSAVMGTQFPDIPFGEFVSPTTTQSRPFMVGPDKRARIPLPLINQ